MCRARDSARAGSTAERRSHPPPRRSGGFRATAHDPASPRAGFTLIEALAALVVTALFVAVVLPYAGRLVSRWWVGEATVESADAWMQAVARMSDDVAQALPFGLGPDGHPAAAFRAGPDTIAFVRSALGRPGALETVIYEVRPTAAGNALIRRSRAFDPATFDQDSVGGAAATLIDGPFRFRMVEITVDGARRRGWAPADGMPEAVELSARAVRRAAVPAAPVLMPIVARLPAIAAKHVTPPPP